MKVIALAGGTGSAKLLRGIQRTMRDFAVICNVGDNFWHHGLYVCPDVDIAMYTLAGISDPVRGWGVKDDTFNVLQQLKTLGQETWFNLGDRDLAVSLARTELLSKGSRLGDATITLCKRLGVTQRLFPSTDDRLETYIETRLGTMHLQEFWVKNRGEPEVSGVEYRGAEGAKPSRHVLEEIEGADRIVFCPANPVTSIMPILEIEGIRKAIERSGARRVAVSPVIDAAPISGPAGKFMRALGLEPTSASVASLYSGLVDVLLIDPKDAPMAADIEGKGVKPVQTSILMSDRESEARLARMTLEA